MTDDHIVAVALLTERDLTVFGQGLRRVYPLEKITDFDDLLGAIDEADRVARAEAERQIPHRPPTAS